MLSTLKRRAYQVLNIDDPDDTVTVLVNGFLIILILINLAGFLLQTFEEISGRYELVFTYIEIFSVAVFSIEYVLRVWVCTLDPPYSRPIAGRLRYMFTNMLAITDLIAILPFYLPVVIPFDLIVIRALRLFRLARLFKLARYSDSLDLIERVIVRQKYFLFVALTLQAILMLVSSAVMYFAEHDAQPDKFSNIFSAMWWGLSSLTAINYAGLYPITPFGRIAGAIIAFLGIIAMALPIGVITAGFEQEMKIARNIEERKTKAGTRKAYLQSLQRGRPR